MVPDVYRVVKRKSIRGGIKVGLSKYESETIINYNDEENDATVYTCNKSLIRRIDALCAKYPEVYRLIKKDKFSKTYTLPKKLIGVKKIRIFTPEQKEKQKRQGKKLAALKGE